MSQHVAEIIWERTSETFDYDDYNRAHVIRLDAGIDIKASAAPSYKGDENRMDPEEAFVASLSSCHMLTFLAIAARKKLTVERYADRAVGVLEKNEDGRLAITRVTLSPKVEFAKDVSIDAAALEKIHHAAHEHCFIANSVKTQVTVE